MDNIALAKALKDQQDQINQLKQRRVGQADIIPGAIKRRHIEDQVIVFGVAADLPSNGDSGILAFYELDTKKLKFWNSGDSGWDEVQFT